MSNITGGSGSFSSGNTYVNGGGHQHQFNSIANSSTTINTNGSITSAAHPAAPDHLVKKKRNLPGNPDPKAEVIALSPRALLATNRFICEICNKGFQRDQNLQLHRRGHNLPWKLKQRNAGVEVRKRVYICPEPGCVHHNPARALGDLTGIKKHFCRKHGEKKWKCEKCSKKYAVQSDWKAHGKTCGTKEYKCDCGTIFSRRDSFITHRAFCDALAEENNKAAITLNPSPTTTMINSSQPQPNNDTNNKNIIISPPNINHFNPLETKINPFTMTSLLPRPPPFSPPNNYNITPTTTTTTATITTTPTPSLFSSSSSATSPPSSLHLIASSAATPPSASMSATALLQKAAQMGSTLSNSIRRPPITVLTAAANVAPKQAPPFGSNDHQQGLFMDQFFHVAAGSFNGNLPSFFDDDGDNNDTNNAVALFKNFGGGDAMTTVDFLGVNNNGGRTTPVPRFSPPL